jgi:hypothetical protein
MATSSTPSRFSRWQLVENDLGAGETGYRIVNVSHRVVCFAYHLDDAESIVKTHNELVRAREEWYGC